MFMVTTHLKAALTAAAALGSVSCVTEELVPTLSHSMSPDGQKTAATIDRTPEPGQYTSAPEMSSAWL
jgi:hypothetical protein